MNQLVKDAIKALDGFGAPTPERVVKVLPMWHRYAEMSADDITAVLDHYRKGGAR